MTISVGARREHFALGDIITAAPARGITQQQLAQQVNHVLARGTELVAGHVVNKTLTAGTAYRFSYRIQPRFQAVERVWSIDARCAESPATISVSIDGGSAVVRPATNELSTTTLPVTIVQKNSQSSAEATTTLDITPGGKDVTIWSISCMEVPRPIFDDGTSEDGTEVGGFTAGQPAAKSAFTNLVDVLSDGSKIGRRCTLSHWGVPHNAGGSPTTTFAVAITSTSYVDIWHSSLWLPALDRKIGPADTTAVVAVKLFAWVTGGTGDFQVITDAGTSSGVSISSTTPAITSAASATLDCEDLESADGRQTAASPDFDEIRIQARKNVSGTLYIAGRSVIGTA